MQKYFAFLLFLSISSALFGKEMKVATPADLQQAISKAAPGDVIIIKNGVWNNAKINFRASGTAQRPIILRAETAGQVLLSGNSGLIIDGSYLVADGLYFKNGSAKTGSVIVFSPHTNFCRLTNTAIIGYNPADKEQDTKWVRMEGKRNRIDHCYFRDKANAGTLITVVVNKEPNYHVIDSNYFGSRPELGKNGAEIIRIGLGQTSESDSYTTVQYNYFEQCDGEHEVISSKTGHNIFRYNTFYKCQGTLSLRHGNNNVVENNFFFGDNVPKTGGIKVFGEGHTITNNYFSNLGGTGVYAALILMNGSDVKSQNFVQYAQVKNDTITDNIFVGNQQNVIVGFNYENGNTRGFAPQNVLIKDNIFYKSNQAFIQKIATDAGVKFDNNIVYGADAGVNDPQGIKTMDPKLEQGQDGVLRASNSSPVAVKNLFAKFKELRTQRQLRVTTAERNSNTDSPITAKNVGTKWVPAGS